MKETLRSYAALMTAATALFWAGGASSSALIAWIGGQLLFTTNLLLLVWLGGRMLSSAADRGGAKPGKLGSLGLLVGMFVKVMLLASGVYVGLVLFDLRPAFFVGGLAAGLACLVGAAVVRASLIRRRADRVLRA